MKNLDSLTMPELLEELVRIRVETEAIKLETEAIKKHGEEAHILRLAEIEAMRKETEALEKKGYEELLALKKETEALEKRGHEELLALKKETEDAEKRGRDELLALEKRGRDELLALEKRGKEELLALKKESEEVDKQLKSTMDRLGFNLGRGLEELFFYSLKGNPILNNIHYDFVNLNVKLLNESGATATEIDLLLVNKNSVGLVEIKHSFRKEDLEKFMNHNYTMFKKYGGNALRTNTYLYIAALSYDDGVITLAKTKGIGILHLKNNLIEEEGEIKSY
ncbi:MAG: hypothetical protein QM539_06035 [Alphaproteobacteria bacterium]|nr:hypothetical protein [Alphaproteobacteria bacterium]